MTNPKSSPDQVTNPYASPRQLSGADQPAIRRPEDSRVYLELTPSCRAIFTLDLVGCVMRGFFLVIVLLMLTQWSVKSRAEAPFFGWLACNAVIVVAGIIGDVMLLNEHPAGRWWGGLSVLATPFGFFFLFSIEGVVLPLTSLPRLVFGIIFLVMYVMALIECGPRKRSNDPPYRWTDFN